MDAYSRPMRILGRSPRRGRREAFVNGPKCRLLPLHGGLVALLLLTAACGRQPTGGPSDTSARTPEKAPAEKSYPLTGEIVAIDAARKVVAVRHEEIKGYMPAMTMEFAVGPGDLAILKVGQHIRAEMIPSKDTAFRLEKIWPADAAVAGTIASGAKALRQDTLIRGKGAYREIGEALPDFALYDQTGQVVQSARFHGKQVMLNFIYSRCPSATMCPLATAKMMATQKLAREAGIPNIEFVSITLDPEYDTPGVLREYADLRGIDTTNFSFLTGPESALRDLFTQFGVIAEFEGDLLKHTLSTLLINENGQIVHRADGSAWEPKDFVAKMKK
jgi:protein SCO1/2